MKKLLGCFLGLMLLFPVSVLAIPTLGVAPGAPGSPGTYLGSSTDASYLGVFADTFLNLPGGDGFLVPSTGTYDITIWFGVNTGTAPDDVYIYLATDAADGGSFTFEGNLFTLNNSLSVADYKPDVYGLNLGTLGSSPYGTWSPLDKGAFEPQDFYYLTGEIDVGDSLEAGEWLFAVADINGRGGIGGGEFSPKTTSSTAPEPATMLLLGSGLIGLAGFGRKKFKK